MCAHISVTEDLVTELFGFLREGPSCLRCFAWYAGTARAVGLPRVRIWEVVRPYDWRIWNGMSFAPKRDCPSSTMPMVSSTHPQAKVNERREKVLRGGLSRVLAARWRLSAEWVCAGCRRYR